MPLYPYITVVLSNNTQAYIFIRHITAVATAAHNVEKCHIWTGGGEDDCFLVNDTRENVLRYIEAFELAPRVHSIPSVNSNQPKPNNETQD